MAEEKTYITPLAKEPEFIIAGKGSLKAKNMGVTSARVKFHRNGRGVGQYATKDPVIQKFLDNHEWMADGRMTCTTEHMIPAEEDETPNGDSEAAPKQTNGPMTSTGPGAIRKRGGRPPKVKVE